VAISIVQGEGSDPDGDDIASARKRVEVHVGCCPRTLRFVSDDPDLWTDWSTALSPSPRRTVVPDMTATKVVVIGALPVTSKPVD